MLELLSFARLLDLILDAFGGSGPAFGLSKERRVHRDRVHRARGETWPGPFRLRSGGLQGVAGRKDTQFTIVGDVWMRQVIAGTSMAPGWPHGDSEAVRWSSCLAQLGD